MVWAASQDASRPGPLPTPPLRFRSSAHLSLRRRRATKKSLDVDAGTCVRRRAHWGGDTGGVRAQRRWKLTGANSGACVRAVAARTSASLLGFAPGRTRCRKKNRCAARRKKKGPRELRARHAATALMRARRGKDACARVVPTLLGADTTECQHY